MSTLWDNILHRDYQVIKEGKKGWKSRTLKISGSEAMKDNLDNIKEKNKQPKSKMGKGYVQRKK